MTSSAGAKNKLKLEMTEEIKEDYRDYNDVAAAFKHFIHKGFGDGTVFLGPNASQTQLENYSNSVEQVRKALPDVPIVLFGSCVST